MLDRKLRAGIVGLGVGKSHAKGYITSPDAELAAICDMNVTRLNEAGDSWHVEHRYSDYAQMFAEAGLDVVSVCLPNALHAAVSIAALEAGIHVVCEKPMAQSLAEAQQMIAAAERNNVRLMVAYNYRYRSDSQWMRRVVQSGLLGDIYHAELQWRRETGIPGWGVFGSKAASGGGSLIDLGVHVLDLGLWMMNFPRPLTVSGSTRAVFGPHSRKTWGRHPGDVIEGGFDVEDGGIGFIRLETGATIVLQATWAEHTHPSEDGFSVELQGSKGTAVLHVNHYSSADTLRLYTEIEDEPVTITPGVRFSGPQAHEGLIVDLMKSLRAGEPTGTSGEQGLAAVSILDALYTSAQEGREIPLV
jgi:predicted dehydrogenase